MSFVRYSGTAGTAYSAVEESGADYPIHAVRLVLESRESNYLHDRQVDPPVYRAVTLHERGVLADCACPLEKRYSRT